VGGGGGGQPGEVGVIMRSITLWRGRGGTIRGTKGRPGWNRDGKGARKNRRKSEDPANKLWVLAKRGKSLNEKGDFVRWRELRRGGERRLTKV